MRKFAPILIALSSTIAILAAAGPASAAGSVCSFTAHAWDTDPAGTNVRSEPNPTAPILAKLPQEVGEGDAAFSPEFDVIGFEKGWFRIANVKVDQYGEGPERTIFQGPGWIAAKLVAFSINNPHLRAAPDASANILAELVGDDWGPGSATVSRVHDCSGAFADVTLKTPDGVEHRGWVTGLCGNQVTTCP